jgi:hypothetical protein
MVQCCGRKDVGIVWGWLLTQSYSVTLHGKLLVTMVCMPSSIQETLSSNILDAANGEFPLFTTV